MAIKYIEGNLFNGDAEVIIHGCNVLGKFGRGFAEQIKKRYPVAAQTYYNVHRKNGLALGSIIWVETKNVVIGHCITQASISDDGKLNVDYEAIRQCMWQVNIAAQEGIIGTRFESGFKSVSMPLIGCDLGGGDWNVVGKIITEELKDTDPNVYVLPNSKNNIKSLPRF